MSMEEAERGDEDLGGIAWLRIEGLVVVIKPDA